MSRHYGVAIHDFYCIKCGKKGIPLARNKGHQHEKLHRKKLYCLYCNEEVNHIECRTAADVEKFKSDFENGVYENEAKESVLACRDSRMRKVYLGA